LLEPSRLLTQKFITGPFFGYDICNLVSHGMTITTPIDCATTPA
jgi:hypothetical protein